MTDCRGYRERLSESLDRPLQPEVRLQLEAHLKVCPACRAEREELQEVRRHLQGLAAVEPPPWLAAKVMARIRAEAGPRASFWKRAVLPLLFNPQLQIASVMLLVATGYYLTRTPPSPADGLDGAASGVLEKTQPAEAPSALKPGAPGLDSRPKLARPEPAPARQREAAVPFKDQELRSEEAQDKSAYAPPPSKDTPRRDAPAPVPATAAGGAGPAGEAGVAARGNVEAPTERKAKKEAPAQKAKADSTERVQAELGAASTMAAPRILRLESAHPQAVPALVAKAADRVGGTLLPPQERDGSRALAVRLEARRLREFVDLLRPAGQVVELPEAPADAAVWMTVTVRW